MSIDGALTASPKAMLLVGLLWSPHPFFLSQGEALGRWSGCLASRWSSGHLAS